jgi:hypothetical protein
MEHHQPSDHLVEDPQETQPIVRGIISHVQSVMEPGHLINGAATKGSICAVR